MREQERHILLFVVVFSGIATAKCTVYMFSRLFFRFMQKQISRVLFLFFFFYSSHVETAFLLLFSPPSLLICVSHTEDNEQGHSWH